MRIDVSGADVALCEPLRGKLVRRVLLTLSRFGPSLRRVSVCLAEPANPLGGTDQRCRMRARLRHDVDVQAEAIHGGFEAAVASAAALLAQRVEIALEGGEGGATRPPLAPPARTRPA